MLLTLREYERIYKVINTLVIYVGNDPAYSCILFSVLGAYILEKHYKIKAELKAGLAAYHIGADNTVIMFGEYDAEGNVTSNGSSFHCWVEAKGWLIDFMAPTFPELYRKSGKKYKIPSNMLQKSLGEMAPSVCHLEKSGDFYLESNPVTMADKMAIVSSSFACSDLAEICVKWYRKPPKKMMKEITIKDQNGKDMSTSFMSTSLKGKSLVGAW